MVIASIEICDVKVSWLMYEYRCAAMAPATPAREAAEGEGQPLVAIELRSVGAGRHVVVADRTPGAAEMRVQQPRPAARQQRPDASVSQ